MNNIVPISKISCRFKDASMNIQSGIVISIFDKVLNIMTEEGVFTFQESSIPFSPLSIVLENSLSIHSLGLKLNSILTFSPSYIKSDNFICHLADVEVIESSLKQVFELQDFVYKLPWLISTLSTVLKNYTTKSEHMGGLMDVVNYMDIKDHIIIFHDIPVDIILLSYFKNKLSDLNVTSSEFSKRLASLVGLGNGLTPSCDDFIVGLMSTLVFSGCKIDILKSFRDNLMKEVIIRLNSTTAVSSAFLDSAISYNFSDPLLNFYKSIIEYDMKNILKSIDDIALTGHSSGIDTLNGILFGLKLISTIK